MNTNKIMSTLRRLVLAFGLLLLAGNAAAAMYKWVDEHGNVHYSDTPHKDARELNLPPLPTYQPPAVSEPTAPAAEEKPADNKPKAEQKKERQYETVAIEVPATDATIRSNSGAVSVRVKLYPRLDNEAKHRIRILIDGKPGDKTYNSGNVIVEGVERGTHTVQAEVLDSAGNVLKTSAAVTFHLLKTSVNTNNKP